MIREILLWYVFIGTMIAIFYRLYNVFEGEHYHEQIPVVHAVVAVVESVFALLWLIFVLGG